MNHIQETTFKSCLTYRSEYTCATHVRLGMRALSRLSNLSEPSGQSRLNNDAYESDCDYG